MSGNNGGGKTPLVRLCSMIGKRVVVCFTTISGHRTGFHTAISVAGNLEQNDVNKDCFRVLLSDDTYAYFKAQDVYEIATTKAMGTVVFICEVTEEVPCDQID